MGKMQRLIGVLLVVAALGLAAYAWTLSKSMVPEKPVMHTVVVANQRIAAGEMLTADKLKLMEFPERPVGSYGEISQLVGLTTPVVISPGEALLAERIAPAVASASLQQLRDGERAVAIRVDEVIAVGNRLAPGDRVDVFASFRRNNDEIVDSHARLLLAGLRILAFGSQETNAEVSRKNNVRAAAETPRTAVLAVPLADVDKLALAAEAGRLLLALRPPESLLGESGPADAAPVVAAPARLSRLRDLTATTAVASRSAAVSGVQPAPAPGVSVRVMHGLKESSVHFQAKQAGAGQ